MNVEAGAAHRDIPIFQHPKNVFNNNIIFEFDHLRYLLGYPWPQDLYVDFSQIYLILSVWSRSGEGGRTFVSKHFGNFVDLIESASLSLNRWVC
jgi:hypothetical protein